jgi:hypothetical protein
MNAAWDGFKIVDNHSKSMIFQMPVDDRSHEDYLEYIRKVAKPISLETIRVSVLKGINQACVVVYRIS